MRVGWSSGLGSLFLVVELTTAVFLGRAFPHIPSAFGKVDATAALSGESPYVDVFKPARGRSRTSASKASIGGDGQTDDKSRVTTLAAWIFTIAALESQRLRGSYVCFEAPSRPEPDLSEPARAPPSIRRIG